MSPLMSRRVPLSSRYRRYPRFRTSVPASQITWAVVPSVTASSLPISTAVGGGPTVSTTAFPTVW